MIFLHGFFACPLVFAPPITFSRLRAFCSCAGWAHGFFSGFFPCAKFMRQSYSENGAQNKKIMHPKTKNPCKIHAGIHAPNLCVKVGPKKGLRTQNPCTPKTKKSCKNSCAHFRSPKLGNGIARATQLCNRKAYANEKGQPYGHVCSTSLSFDPSPYRATFCH